MFRNDWTYTRSSLADTTNSGATTNSQTNTSGSNTTISGGYPRNQLLHTKAGLVVIPQVRLILPQTTIQI